MCHWSIGEVGIQIVFLYLDQRQTATALLRWKVAQGSETEQRHELSQWANGRVHDLQHHITCLLVHSTGGQDDREHGNDQGSQCKTEEVLNCKDMSQGPVTEKM